MTSVPATSGRVPPATAFWLVAATFLALMSFTTVPTPLYPLYEAADGFSSFMVTVVFAAYGCGVIAGLFLLGHVSDWLGRRTMILAAVGLELVSALVFALSSAVPALLVARFVCGFGIGVLTAAATAHLTELHALGHPDGETRFASTVATVVNTGGLALGPLVGALLTQWWPHPLTLPFVGYVAVILLLGALLLAVPETVTRPQRRTPYRPQRVRVDQAARAEFLAAAVGAAAAFSVLGTFTSLTATFTGEILQRHSRLLTGAVVFGVLGSSAVAQLLLGRLPLRQRLRLGRTLIVAGLASTALSALVASLVLFVLGGLLAGAGVGLVFQATIATALRLATRGQEAETVSGMFLAAYLGITVPVVAVGVALTLADDPVAVLVAFAAIVMVTVAYAVSRMLRAQSAPSEEPAARP